MTVLDGFLRVWREGGQDGTRGGGVPESERPLSAMEEGERVFVSEVRRERGFTCPPTALHRGELVRVLEELGIDWSSTYASIAGALRECGYPAMTRAIAEPTRSAAASMSRSSRWA